MVFITIIFGNHKKKISINLVYRLSKVSSVIVLKWENSCSDSMEFETGTAKFFERFTIIDINLLFTISFMMGARGIENRPYHYSPEFGIDMIGDLRDNRF